jgi:hypothetical protein
MICFLFTSKYSQGTYSRYVTMILEIDKVVKLKFGNEEWDWR